MDFYSKYELEGRARYAVVQFIERFERTDPEVHAAIITHAGNCIRDKYSNIKSVPEHEHVMLNHLHEKWPEWSLLNSKDSRRKMWRDITLNCCCETLMEVIKITFNDINVPVSFNTYKPGVM